MEQPRGVGITLTDGDMRTVINCAENLRMNGVPSEVVSEQHLSVQAPEHEERAGNGVAGGGSVARVPIARCCR